MYCCYCGTKLPDDARVCSKCGKKLPTQSGSDTNLNTLSTLGKIPETNTTRHAKNNKQTHNLNTLSTVGKNPGTNTTRYAKNNKQTHNRDPYKRERRFAKGVLIVFGLMACLILWMAIKEGTSSNTEVKNPQQQTSGNGVSADDATVFETKGENGEVVYYTDSLEKAKELEDAGYTVIYKPGNELSQLEQEILDIMNQLPSDAPDYNTN